MQDYNKAIKLNANNVLAYRNRGVAHYEQGNFEQAIQDLKKAEDLLKEQGRIGERQKVLNY